MRLLEHRAPATWLSACDVQLSPAGGADYQSSDYAPDQEKAEHLLGNFLDRYSKTPPKLVQWAEQRYLVFGE